MQLSGYSLSPPDNKGIGGGWKPYALDANPNIDSDSHENGDSVAYINDSEQPSPIYIESENPINGQLGSLWTVIPDLPDDVLSITIRLSPRESGQPLVYIVEYDTFR